MNFTILSKDAENLLEELSGAKNPEKTLNEELKKAEEISEIKARELRRFERELIDAKYIERRNWGMGTTSVDIHVSINTYRKRLKEYKELLREINASDSGSVTNIDNSTHNNLNIDGNSNALGNVSFSSGSNNED